MRIVEAKTGVPMPEHAYILRDGSGQVIAPQTAEDGELSFLVHDRKLIVEPVTKGLKQFSQSFVLEDAPLVYVRLAVDEITGRVTEVQQKAVPFDQGPKAHRSRGRLGFSGGGASDDCATAPTVGCNSTTNFNNAAGSTVAGDPAFSCRFGGAGQGFGTAWFKFIATGTTATIDTNGSATGDTMLAIYTGTCGAFVEIGCDDDSGTGLLSSESLVGLTIGQTYYIQVAGFGAGNVGNNVLNVACGGGGPPVHDVCATAPTVNCNSSTVFSNAACTTSVTDPNFSCRFGGPGQGFGTSWFKFVAVGPGATLDTNGSLTGDTMLAVYSGTCGALVELACDDDSGAGLLSLLNVGGLVVGQTYYIQVAGFGAGNIGTNTLNVTCLLGPPPGDACADAILVPCGGSDTFNNTAFITDPGDPAYSCRFGGPGQGINAGWFKFVATNTSANVNTLGSTAFDTMIAVYSGTCGAFVELACNDDAFGLLSDVCATGLTIGQTYYIQASSFSIFDTGDITVNIECPCPVPPANDDCENAVGLELPASVTFDNTLATDDIGVPCGVFSGPFRNVWYSVAGTGTTLTATTCNGGTIVSDTIISIFCGDCLEPICVAGNDDNCAGGGPVFASTVSWCSQIGGSYLITVGNFSPATTPGTIQLDVVNTGSACVASVICLPQGGCCLPDGSCVVTTFDDCSEQGGSYQGDGSECTANAVNDGSFEAGVFSGNWNESSTNFGTPLCDAGCGFGGGSGPNTGSFWAWFGGIPAFEEGAVSQVVNIPVGATTLDFFLEVPVSSGNGVDFLEVTVDGNQEYLVLENIGPFLGYTLQQVNIAAYANGGNHTIEFHSIITGAGGDFTNFFVDDVAVNTVVISCDQPEDCFVLDFETDDSGAAMAHGTHVNTEFDGGANFPVTITGSANPSGNDTTAILNSSTGPAAQDPDLLVGSGNILIVQNDGNQSFCGPDIYCTHNDDDDGGLLTFEFNVGVTPSTIDLIDVDSTDGQWIITLFDGSGSDQRVYNVQAGWTGDLVTDATSGMGTLSLTTLAPQPGFNGTLAGGGEIGDFDPTDVVRIRVNIVGSGAVDNLTWCQPGQ